MASDAAAEGATRGNSQGCAVTDSTPATAALTTAYLAGALVLLGVAFLVAAFVFAFALHDWQRAFYALLWSYPIGSWGDRMIRRAREQAHA